MNARGSVCLMLEPTAVPNQRASIYPADCFRRPPPCLPTQRLVPLAPSKRGL
jgi:hypothetical protein